MSTIVTRNMRYALRHPVRTYRIRKACREHVKNNPFCAWCGTMDGVQAHHIIPLWKDDSLGANPENFISLCGKRCHLAIGHSNSFAYKYVENVKSICEARIIFVRPRDL